MQTHVHPCGHECACAVEDADVCVQEALHGTDTLAEREAIWRARWPPEHPHPSDGPELPQQHRP